MADLIQPIADNTSQRPRHPLKHAAILAVSWAIVLFIVQEYTTGSNYPLSMVAAVGSRVVRFVLDLLACGIAVVLLTGWPIYLALLAWALTLSVLTVYYEYFGKALTWTTIHNHFDEGLAIGGYAVQLLRWQSLLLIVLATFILAVLACRSNRRPLPHRRRVTIGIALGVSYLFTAFLSTQYLDKLNKLKRFGTVDRLAMTHGYLLTWLGEWRYLDGDALFARAMEAAKVKQDRLTPIEARPSVGHKVAIIQVESLDWAVLDFQVAGQPVMPFLSDLSRRSMRYRISAVHESGSCDSDFVMLMGLHPVGDATPYVVPGFDWSPSLAAVAARSGYETVFLHGSNRSFFNRGAAISKMGFDVMLFREDLESRYGLQSRLWGVSDKDVFGVSSNLFKQGAERALHFIITLTSHGPYHFLDPADCELYVKPRSQKEHYLNSMRYVDRQLRTYFEDLPEDTLVVLYGDHSSHVDYGQGPSKKGHEYVPLLIHQLGTNLAELQRTREQELAVSGELTTLDAAGYVWSLLRNAAN